MIYKFHEEMSQNSHQRNDNELVDDIIYLSINVYILHVNSNEC